jgi:hypothetical protein
MEKIIDSCPPVVEGITNVQTPNGIGKYVGLKITELGRIMMRVYFEEEERYINYTVGSIPNLLSGSELQICE